VANLGLKFSYGRPPNPRSQKAKRGRSESKKLGGAAIIIIDPHFPIGEFETFSSSLA
jgi:hypothetical protein